MEDHDRFAGVKKYLASVPEMMREVDALLDEAREDTFAHGIARLMSHAETLAKTVEDALWRSEIAVSIMCSVFEYETAWNLLRLGHLPGMFRQVRVANEWLGLGILTATPRERLMGSLGKEGHTLGPKMATQPQKTVFQLYMPQVGERDDRRHVSGPLVKSGLLSAYRIALKDVYRFSDDWIDEIRSAADSVWHPSSHASLRGLMHFIDSMKNARHVGLRVEDEHPEKYDGAAEFLGNTVHVDANHLRMIEVALAAFNSAGKD